MNVRTRTSLFALALVLGATACDSPTEDSIRLTVRSDTLEAVGDAGQMEALVSGSDRLPEWESLSPQVATVTRAGMVTAVAPGTARVRAAIGGRTAEGEVVVLPSAQVQLTSVTRDVDPSGQPRITLALRNAGGRGYYRTEFWQARATAGGEHRVVMRENTDTEAPVGLNVTSSTSLPGVANVDWVIVHSRDAHSTGYRTTGCIRLDGGSPCPLP